MVNPIASQAASYITAPNQLDIQIDSKAEVQVNPSDKPETQAQGQPFTKAPEVKTWPKRKPIDEIIEAPKSSLDTAIEQLNNKLKPWSTGVRFDIDPDTQRLVVSLVDSESGEVIRAVPSEAVLQISKMIAEFQGNGINTKA